VDRKQERFFTGVFLFCVCLQLAQAVHSAWFSLSVRLAHSPFDPAPVLYAPHTYRIALPALIRFVSSAFHISDSTYVAAAFDLIASFLALYLLYLLTVNSLPETRNTQKNRTISILLFLAIIQSPLSWVVPWQRPETLPSTLYLAICLFALANIRANKLWLLALLAATLCQGFVRTDVAFVFGVSVLAVGLWSAFKNSFEASGIQIAAGALIALVSGASQAYLQFIRFPHLTYPPDTRMIQLTSNLIPHRLEVCTVALLPFLLFFIFLIVKRPTLDDLEKIVIVSSVLYLPLWFTLGFISEVRIFVPFLFALSMVAARVLASSLSNKKTNTANYSSPH
jgi:hypothetical protein